MRELMTLAWPVEQLGEAIEAVARRRGLSPRTERTLEPPRDLHRVGDQQLSEWMESTAAALGLEAEPVEVTYAEIESLVRGAGPVLLRLPSTDGLGEPRFLTLLSGGPHRVTLLSPDLVVRRVKCDVIGNVLRFPMERPLESSVSELLNRAGVARRLHTRTRAAILREQLSETRIMGGWLLRVPASANLWQQLRDACLTRSLLAPAGFYTLQYLLTLCAWWVLGTRALSGRFDRGWLIAWALLVLTAVPFQLLATWMQGRFVIGAAGILKRRLLYGAMRLEPEEVRHKGAGHLLGEIMESSAVETLALNGGFLALVAAIELIMAAAVLSLGAGGGLTVLLLCAWVALTILLCRRYFRHCRDWTATRLTMTNDLVERMVGHRTRLAQEGPDRWHEGEDHLVEAYLDRSIVMDRSAVLQAMIPRGWLVICLLGLAPSFVSGGGSPPALAVSIGGALLGLHALQKLTSSWSSLTGAAIAWKQVAHLSRAAARPEDRGAAAGTGHPDDLRSDAHRPGKGNSVALNSSPSVVMEAHDLSFRYREAGEPVLSACNLQIREGDRLLLEGASGSGKSTLASLLTGLRAPASGLLLIDGLDKHTLGDREWRKRVAAAPQFHENHVLTGTFAFNLLLGREWPPSARDLTDAEAICRELGLGDLLERMPAGLQQMVGETGWQLSHGERSRLFLARALLQRGKMVVLDESFGALDPETLKRSLNCALERAETLLVIAHP